ELPEEAAHAVLVLRDRRVQLAVAALEVGVGDETRAAVAGTRDEDRAQVALLHHPAQVRVQEVQAGRRSPVAEQARLHVLRADQLAEQRVVEEVDLPDGEVVRCAPVRVEQPELLVHHVFALVAASTRRKRTRASTATAPAGPASTGFRSSSDTSGKSSASWESRWRTSPIAARSAGGRPRQPATSFAALPVVSAISTSTSVRGASAKRAEPISSARVPPGPNATSGPNTGSCTTPARSSAPPARKGCTTTGQPMRSAARRTSSSERRSSATPPDSVLCAPAAAVFTTAGSPSDRAAAAASSGVAPDSSGTSGRP